MIQLICSKCHAELTVDDAFAGGVCRCQHCGTIQTVPKQTKSKRDAGPATSKTIYTKPEAGKPASRSELEALADAVSTSSGLSSKRLRQKTVDYATPGEKKRPTWIVWAAVGAVVLIALALGLAVVGRSSVTVSVLPATRTPVSGGASALPVAATVPQFLGVPVDAPSIIYILDRGSGASDWFSYLLEATFRSTATLGGDRKFQIVFWSNGEDEPAFPSGGPEFATDSTVAAARKALDSLEARGQTDPMPAIKRALAKRPDVIVIATGKGTQLDSSFTSQVMSLRGDAKTRIDTFNIADSDIGSALSELSKQTGGTATPISEDELKRFAKQ